MDRGSKPKYNIKGISMGGQIYRKEKECGKLGNKCRSELCHAFSWRRHIYLNKFGNRLQTSCIKLKLSLYTDTYWKEI